MSKYDIVTHIRKNRSISQTANELSYTPSAISQAVKNYEKVLGMRLFNNTKNGMTECGDAVEILDCIEQISELEEKIANIAARKTDLKYGHIKIGTIQSISYHWLPKILAEFKAAYPDITYDVYVCGFKELNSKLENFELDCIFTSEYASPNTDFHPLAKDELMLVTPREHPLADKLSVSVEAVHTHEFISSSDGLEYETGTIFKDRGIEPKCSFGVNEDYATLKMVESGLGIAILPKLLLDGAPFNVCIRQFSEHYTRILGIARNQAGEMSPALERFIEVTEETVKTCF